MQNEGEILRSRFLIIELTNWNKEDQETDEESSPVEKEVVMLQTRK